MSKARMNKQQRTHIENRIWSIRLHKKEFLDNQRSKEISDVLVVGRRHRVEQILSGIAKIKKEIPLDATTITQVFDFQESTLNDVDKVIANITEKFNNRWRDIEQMATNLTDKAILGSSEEAIQILQDFEAY